MTPKELVLKWVDFFNQGNTDEIVSLYHEDAINHQVANEPVIGKKAIHNMFETEFESFDMTCIADNLFEDGEWAILEWKDTLEMRGCGFFHVVENKIKFQRGYWDKLSFLKEQGLPIPE